jgi:hypothetical protein
LRTFNKLPDQASTELSRKLLFAEFFNSIGQWQTFADATCMSALPSESRHASAFSASPRWVDAVEKGLAIIGEQ